MSADGQTPVDTESPWLGLASFTEETRAYFHGREEEVAELGRRVQRKLLTVLFGQSGLGKTSILRAGIVPRLRPLGYCPVYVRIDYAPESPAPAEQIKQAIFRATESSGHWTQPGTSVAGESLWEFLHHRDDILKDASGKTLVPLLIFDQFEEIFTIAQTDDAVRQRAVEFFGELADLVENRAPRALEERFEADDSFISKFDFARADYRILISLREDYLAHLEGVKASMPSITQNRMRIARMTGDQALAAVMKPGGRLVTQEVAEAIVRFVAGGSELRNAEVEPALLSLICRELNNARIAQGRAEITADVLAGSHDTILNEFYERALADQPAAVRRFIEDAMLTESGFRESLAEERVAKAFANAGAAPEALATLVNRRLLRVEERLDVRRVELTHDVLCAVVGASRDLRHEREARDAAERQLAEQKAREEATRHALVRARKIAAGCIVLAAVAVAGAIFGYINMNRARDAEAAALQTRQLAEGARGEAEKLVVFLLDDFYLEMEPIGRLDIMAGLAKRALDYYNGLPPALRTPDTDRNRALAEVRYGAALRTLGRLDEGMKALDSAIPTLEKLREGGDKSEITAIGLAMGLSAKGRILSSQNRNEEEREMGAKSVAVLEPLRSAPDSSVAVRRAYGEATNSHGFTLMRNSQAEEAVKMLEASREAFRSIDGLKLGDLTAAARFAEATAWQMNAMQELGQSDLARRNGEEAKAVATRVLEARPGHMMALRARALVTSSLADYQSNALRSREALPNIASCVADWESFLKLDPRNTIAQNNLGACRLQLAFNLENLGRPREALGYFRLATAAVDRSQLPANTARNLAFVWYQVARLEADFGNVEASAGAIRESVGMGELAVRSLSKDVYFRRMIPAWEPLVEGRRRLVLGDFAAGRELNRKALAVLEAFDPPADGDKRNRAGWTSDAAGAIGESAYHLKDYAEAEVALRKALEARRLTRQRDLLTESFRADNSTLLAMVLARLGRPADARAALAASLEFERHAAGVRDVEGVRFLVAYIRLAQAMATPAEARPLLAEAMKLVDGLPAEMRSLKSTQRLRDEIAREMAAQR